MPRKRIRKLLKRLIIWAVEDSEPRAVLNLDPRLGTADIFVTGISTKEGRRAVINTIKTARTNREM